MEIKFLGTVNEENFMDNMKACTAAGMLSRSEGTVFDIIEKVEKMSPETVEKIIKKIVNMGHTAIIDHDYFLFAISEVSPVVEQIIIASRFCSFTIKSRREVDFGKVGYITPQFKDQNLEKEYKEHMDYLFESYQRLLDEGISKEDSRYILPYSYYSQIIMGMSATELEKLINMLVNTKKGNITELKEFGIELRNIATTRAPYLKVLTEKRQSKDYSEIEKILNEKLEIPKQEKIDSPILLSYTNNIDETIITNILMRVYNISFETAKEMYDTSMKEDEQLCFELLKACQDEFNRVDLTSINFRFQVPFSFANLTHITRHRTVDLSIPDFVPNTNLTNYIIPPKVEENEKARSIFLEVMKRNLEVYKKFKDLSVREEDLVYFTLSGNVVNIIAAFNGENFRHITSLRECRKAQWEIRGLLNKMDELISEKCKYYSQVIGANCATLGRCPEGKESCKIPYAKKGNMGNFNIG